MDVPKDPRSCQSGDITIRRMGSADVDAAMGLKDAAGWNQVRTDWETFLKLRPEGCFAAVYDGRLVGTATAMDYNSRIGWIAMVLVDPAFRRRGIGTHLMNAALESLQHCDSIKLDATPAGRELYRTLGFKDELRLTRMCTSTVKTTALDVPGEAERLDEADLPEAALLDARTFGTSRLELLREVRRNAPEYAFKQTAAGRMTGFVLGRHGSTWEQLGPIVAPDLRTAAGLLHAGLLAAKGRQVLLDVPDEQELWGRPLRKIGFQAQRPLIRMYRGRTVTGETDELFAILGPDLG